MAAPPAAAAPGQGYQDAQTLASKLDLTNPNHQAAFAALRQVPRDAPALPPALGQQVGNLLHPAAPQAPAGMQHAQTVQAAQQQVEQNQLVKAPIDEVVSQMQSTGVTDQNRDYLNSRIEDAVREAVANGADEGTVRQLIQSKLHGQFQQAFVPESPVNSFLSTAAMATPLGILPKLLQQRHQAANQNIASFINQPTSE